MNHLKTLGLAAVMAVGLVAVLSSPASATVLCTNSGCTTTYASGTTIHYTLKSGTSTVLKNTSGETLATCSGSTISSKTTSESGTKVSANIESLTWSGCSQTTDTIKNGSLSITWTSGSNGSVSGAESQVTLSIFGATCTYGTGEGTTLGTLTGGETPVLAISAVVPKTAGSFLCPSTGKWTAEYVITEPHALYVGKEKGSGGGPTSTTLTTSLSGESKSGEEITVNEGSKVKDTATLSGTNASKATGTVKYKVYADKECKELVTSAGEVTVSEGKVPASEEKELEAGRVYYWQAEYSGDTNNLSSKSTCGKEVLTVKAKTTLATSLSGESKSGEEITVNEGAKVKDTATLSGTKSSTATGKVKFKVYKDKECKELASEAGEGSLSEANATSEEKTLEAGRVYYWQAEYPGDSLHQASTGTCGKEVLTVKAATSLSTLLGGEDPIDEESIEGEEISVPKGSAVVDSATLTGTNVATATGKVKFKVYKDKECKELFAEAGEASVEEASAAPSEEVELEEGTYYWQATYEGDTLHQAATSPCTEVVHVVADTSLTTTLSGEGKKGETIEVSEEAHISDTATLGGEKASEATGTVKYRVYSDIACKKLVAEAGEVTVTGKSVPASSELVLEPGVYFWQAVYSGDAVNQASTSPCGSEVALVVPRVTTTLTGGGESGAAVSVPEGTPVHDQATLQGENAGEATGTLEYLVYADEKCEKLVAEAGEVEVEGATVPASASVELEAPGTYYWRAVYSGDELNPASTSPCGSEVAIVTVPTSLTTSLSGGEEEGAEISVEEGTAVSDRAILSGAKAATASGTVSYSVYVDSGCTESAAPAGVGTVEEGVAEPSSEVTLPPGTYYWQAEYPGDGVNARTIGECGAEVEHVTAPITTSLSGEGQSGTEIQVAEGASVTDQATLHGEHAGEATGTVEYLVYSDESCEKLLTKAGPFEFKEGKVPSSGSVEIKEPGVYFWRVIYSGDAKNPAATSPCGSEIVQEVNPNGVFMAFGNSYSSGEGVRADGGSYYKQTDTWKRPKYGGNLCHRSKLAWPALIAHKAFGGDTAIQEPDIYKRSSRFIFRACSGAKTANMWAGPGSEQGGQYNEFEEPKGIWLKTPAQLTWLPVKADPDITQVSVGVGGNDAGFGSIPGACWAVSRRYLPLKKYDPTSCLAEIAKWEAAGFPEIEARLPVILAQIAQTAPNAQIRIFLYPKVFKPGLPQISVGAGIVIDNTGTKDGVTAAVGIDNFIGALNTTIKKSVDKAKIKKAEAIPATESVLTDFGDHRLGDKTPWLNGLWFHLEESFHPNICGHKAIAEIAKRSIAPKEGAIGTC